MDIGSVDIAAMSLQMSAQKTQTSVTTSIMKKSMDAQSEIAQTLINDLMAVSPASSKIDISV